MSLAQIRDVTRSGAKEATLRDILAIQLDTWKARREEAERGQAIVEAALEHLACHRTLSVDELCDLIRSLQMTTSLSDAEYYQLSPEFGVARLSREGTKLFFDAPPATSAEELHHYEFERDERGRITALVVHQQGAAFRFPRVDAAAAEQLKTQLSLRVESQKPIPGSADALRRLIDGILAGDPPYEDMSPRWRTSFAPNDSSCNSSRRTWVPFEPSISAASAAKAGTSMTSSASAIPPDGKSCCFRRQQDPGRKSRMDCADQVAHSIRGKAGRLPRMPLFIG